MSYNSSDLFHVNLSKLEQNPASGYANLLNRAFY